MDRMSQQNPVETSKSGQMVFYKKVTIMNWKKSVPVCCYMIQRIYWSTSQKNTVHPRLRVQITRPDITVTDKTHNSSVGQAKSSELSNLLL